MSAEDHDALVLVRGLAERQDLNNRFARSMGTKKGERMGIELLLGAERVWVRKKNVVRVWNAKEVKELAERLKMAEEEKTDALLYLHSLDTVVDSGVGWQVHDLTLGDEKPTAAPPPSPVRTEETAASPVQD